MTSSPRVRDFASDGALVIGGGRAILLQIGDPVVAAGVARHSDFSHRPLDRLRNTLTFVYAVMLGTPAEAQLVATFVNRAHEPVAGSTDAGRQLWVAATLYDTAVRVHERLAGPLSPADADEIYDSYAAIGSALQAAPWPSTRDAFARYWADAVARLEVGDDARRITRDLFHPAVAPCWLRAGLPLAALLTASLLDPSQRAAYGFRWSKRLERRSRTAWTVIRLIVRFSPRRLREWPSRYLLGALRSR